jgi:hypothetical protein
VLCSAAKVFSILQCLLEFGVLVFELLVPPFSLTEACFRLVIAAVILSAGQYAEGVDPSHLVASRSSMICFVNRPVGVAL